MTLLLRINDIHKWIVFISAAIAYAHIIGFWFALGSLFPTIMTNFEVTRAKSSLIQSVYVVCIYGGGVSYGILTDKFGPKWIGLLGASLTSTGLFISFWSNSLAYLVVSIGFIKGCGAGMILVTSSTAVRQQFSGKQCIIVLSIVVSGSGVVGTALIYLYRYLSRIYGLNGALLIMSGLDMNCAALSLLWKPPQSKRSNENTRTATHKIMTEDKDIAKYTVELENTQSEVTEENKCTYKDVEYANQGVELISDNDQAKTRKQNNSIEGNENNDESLKTATTVNIYNTDISLNKPDSKENAGVLSQRRHKLSSVDSEIKVSSIEGENENLSYVKEKKLGQSDKAYLATIRKLNTIIRVKSFVFTMIGLALSLNCSLMFVVFVVDIIMDKGYMESEGTLGLTVITIANILGRLTHGTLLKCPFDTTFGLPIIATALSTLAMVVMALVDNLEVNYVLCCLLGNALGVQVSVIVVTSAEILDKQYLPYAIGMLITVTGLPYLAVGPVAGAIRDVTGSYTSTILVTAAMNGFGLVMFILAQCFYTKKNYIED